MPQKGRTPKPRFDRERASQQARRDPEVQRLLEGYNLRLSEILTPAEMTIYQGYIAECDRTGARAERTSLPPALLAKIEHDPIACALFKSIQRLALPRLREKGA